METLKLLARLWRESLRTRWCARKIKPYSALLRGEIAPSVETVWDEEKYFVQYQARPHEYKREPHRCIICAAMCVTIIMVRGEFSIFQPEIASPRTFSYESQDFAPASYNGLE